MCSILIKSVINFNITNTLKIEKIKFYIMFYIKGHSFYIYFLFSTLLKYFQEIEYV